LLERYDETFLDRQVRIDNLGRAKRFAEMILAEQHQNTEWTKVHENLHYLYDQVREILSMINFDSEKKRWFVQVLRREYITKLERDIRLDQLDDVKKLTEVLAKSEPHRCKIILDNFKKYIEERENSTST
jgi:tRNA C32,U32 (ribose-2'-O)-methylase TrmJ